VAPHGQVVIASLEPAAAAQLLAGIERRDPAGTATLADVARDAACGLCFAATEATTDSRAVYVVDAHHGQLRVRWCMGEGAVDWTRTLLPAIEAQAARAGLHSVAFQTARRGLVRLAERQGYEVTGWILRKDVA